MADHFSRRHFLWTAASAVAAAGVRGDAQTAQSSALTVNAVIARLQGKLGVAWREGSSDGLKAGAADAIVTGVATTVMPTVDVLRRAAAAGHNFVLTQEPAFYTAAEDGGNRPSDGVYLAKKAFVEERHLVIWRLSDHWNARRPNEAVKALANALGWSAYRQPDVEGLYKVPDMRLDALVDHVRARLRARGGLRWLGRPNMMVRTVLLSPGTTDLPSTVARMPRADVIIAGEPREWEAVPYVLDTRPRKGLISVGRVVSLEPSAAACAAWVRSVVSDVPVEAVAAGDPYWSPAFAPSASAGRVAP
jgi:hypothetical protein